MKNLKAILIGSVVTLGIAFAVNSNIQSSVIAATATKEQVKPTTTVTSPVVAPQTAPITVNSLELVNNPSKYLNKRVTIKATFDKFSNLGLDYKPAYKSSEEYITFLIKRENVSHNIPLSEMKNFMKRSMTEKFIDLETGDVIEYSGLVFSNALGDVWIDVTSLKVIEKKNKPTPDKKK